MSDIALVIPARLGSTRLARKALADIEGQPMVVRVAQCAARVSGVAHILVATDSEEISNAVKKAGFEAVITPETLASGTDRVAYVAEKLSAPIIVNLQGDEPVMPPATIAAAIRPVKERGAWMGSAFTRFASIQEYKQASCVKVLTDAEQNAIYFSRHTLPFAQNPVKDEDILQNPHLGKHLGLYVYQRDFLLRFPHLPHCFAEKAESLEQLRALHHGFKIGMGFAEEGSQSVDTAEDLEKARRIYRERFLGKENLKM